MFYLIQKLKTQGGPYSAETRRRFGVISGLVGILLNLLLFGGKLTVALLSGSVAIIADAFNNLSDAGSSVITIVGFRLSGKKADPEHPFGHGRFEYIAGFIVSVVILLMGYELAKSSIKGIISPTPVEFNAVTLVVLAASICIKLYMALYNRKLANLIDSAAIGAVTRDSLSDVAATSAVLVSLIVSRYTTLNLDSWAGLAVSVFILYSGVSSAKDTLAPLLGTPPSKELVTEIEKIVMSHEQITGMHDLVVHNYGPGRLMISLHAEVPSSIEVFEAHAVIDDAEKVLEEKLGCEAVIHFDPIDTNDQELARLRDIVTNVVRNIDESITIHDFRYIPGTSHTNLVFDIVVQYGCKKCDEDLKKQISDEVGKLLPNHNCVIKCDRSFV
ncbi:MAG: cation-efflux pump [Firmicutes bacterium HGW-Firmicutes-16]|nr:MAG: cation-efflux pump [Firmicutes bacterium HGW-Firmicutes-16]